LSALLPFENPRRVFIGFAGAEDVTFDETLSLYAYIHKFLHVKFINIEI